MDIAKAGAADCREHCQCVFSDDGDGFEITIPVSVSRTGIVGTARLHCVVAPDSHRIELMEWNNADLRPAALLNEIRQKVSAALRLVAEQQICGSPHICPAQIAKIVSAHG